MAGQTKGGGIINNPRKTDKPKNVRIKRGNNPHSLNPISMDGDNNRNILVVVEPFHDKYSYTHRL